MPSCRCLVRTLQTGTKAQSDLQCRKRTSFDRYVAIFRSERTLAVKRSQEVVNQEIRRHRERGARPFLLLTISCREDPKMAQSGSKQCPHRSKRLLLLPSNADRRVNMLRAVLAAFAEIGAQPG